MKAILPTRLILWMTLGMLGFSSTALIFQPPLLVGADQTIEPKEKRKISLRSAVPKEIKVVGIRNYDADDWYEKFEFEIKNDSKKDIWYIHFLVGLPEYSKEDELLVFVMRFGDNTRISEAIKNPNKPLIRAGEGHVFKIPPYQVENMKKRISPDGTTLPPVKHLKLELYKIFFTDGTGYLGGKAINLNPDGTYTWATQNNLSFRPLRPPNNKVQPSSATRAPP